MKCFTEWKKNAKILYLNLNLNCSVAFELRTLPVTSSLPLTTIYFRINENSLLSYPKYILLLGTNELFMPHLPPLSQGCAYRRALYELISLPASTEMHLFSCSNPNVCQTHAPPTCHGVFHARRRLDGAQLLSLEMIWITVCPDLFKNGTGKEIYRPCFLIFFFFFYIHL